MGAATASDVGTGRLDRRTVLKGVGAGSVVPLAGCLGTYDAVVGDSSGPEPVRVGVLAPNPQSDFIGRSMVQSAQVAVDERNDDHDGIDDRAVELVVGDTNGSPLEAKREYQRLVLEENVDVTVGTFASEALVNIMDEIAEQETLHLTSGAATQEVSQLVREEYERYKYHFRVGPTNDTDLGRAQIGFMNDVAGDIGWESIAVLAEDYPWADVPWETVQDRIDDTPVENVLSRRYAPSKNDFTDLYDEIADAGADAAFIMTAHTGNDALFDWSYPNRPAEPPQPQPFAFGGIHVPMQLPTYYEQTNGACRYGVSYSAATEQSEITEKTPQFVDKYEETFGTYPQDMGYYTYDAINLFAEVAESEESLDSADLVPVIEDISYTGATGNVRFYDPDDTYAHDRVYDPDDPTTVGVYFQWQENDEGVGVREVIWPDEYATSEYVTPPWLE
ncbi:branched-chain amino acid ABC transporter substrate-binding protein [Natronolimnohabitans innermongolicus JCM 12255]|uniref:Branched-chain amino acid ABC transporter substrate-binding protein n=2 Tax=Natronolimnohabitans innermongolicus TaxID=253107 RepID=L9WU31_9EURY|nr:branched-chain amino acid ABC transporter substrate-binding protein [Natronolimnohabitans innermongolicus JCM 12255]